MNSLDVINDTLSAIERGDFRRASELVSDDLRFVGPTPVPLGKNDFIHLHEALVAGMPDWKFNQNLREVSPGRVEGSVRVEGTHTGTLNLPTLGVKNVKPTNRHVVNPSEPISIEVRNGKISRIEATVIENGGVSGMLTKLGVSVAHA